MFILNVQKMTNIMNNVDLMSKKSLYSVAEISPEASMPTS